MALPFWQVDAFAERPFEGNPAAVIRLDAWLEDDLMQAIALEMNLSETAFVVPTAPARYRLRWFTPSVEVDLCGHATLGAAHVLYETGAVPHGVPVSFDTRSGELVVQCRTAGRLQMDFPAEPVRREAVPAGLEAALGASVVAYGRNRMDALAQLADSGTVRRLDPDLNAIGRMDVRGLIVTAVEPPGSADHFVSRFFGPQSGVPEDPVTGSAHCALGPWWGAILGRTELSGWQASARGGRVGIRLLADRVELSGSATTIATGELRITV